MTSGNCNYCSLAGLPFLVFGLACLTFVCSYAISAAYDLIDTVLPFISDTGTLAPASCWFGLLLNATAYTLGFTAVVRFLQIREQLTHRKKEVCGVNTLSFVLGLVGALGISIVACFQETSVMIMHSLGANLAFVGASIYMCLQNYLTFVLVKQTLLLHKGLLIFRGVLSIVYIITLFTFIIPAYNCGFNFPPYDEKNRPYENAELYYLSTASEWTLAMLFFVYILTFGYEFHTLTVSLSVTTRDGFIPTQTAQSVQSEDLAKEESVIQT